MSTLCLILGTRPEIIKLSPIIRECKKRKLPFFIVHTNQHYSTNLDRIFFKELQLPQPKYNLHVGSGTHAEETGKMLMGIEKVLLKEKPRMVVVLGDTNTALAGALAAVKMHIPIAHVEAGGRSYVKEMPEEINRIVADHISDYLFVSVQREKHILLREGIARKNIFVVGNTIIDAVYHNVAIAQKTSTILQTLNIEKKRYILATAHRQENVDMPGRLKNILRGLALLNAKLSLPIIYPLHPRTKKRIQEFRITMPKMITAIEPLGYIDFLALETNALVTVTDSGGVQEESCALKIPCAIIRDCNEWPELLKSGASLLVGVNPKKILAGVERLVANVKKWKNPLGNGDTAVKILNVITDQALTKV